MCKSMLEVKYRNTDELIPYARNARTHSESQIAQIAASIKEFGFNNPILLDGDNGVIAGHGRLLAAQKLGLKQVPCIELSHLTETQKKAYILADNKIALNSGWDFDTLSIELEDLKLNDINVELTGFNLEEIEGLQDPLSALDEEDFSNLGGDQKDIFNVTFSFNKEDEDLIKNFITDKGKPFITDLITREAKKNA